MSDELNLLNITALRQCLDLTWYLLRKYQRLGIIGKPYAYVRGNPVWKIADVDQIQARINQHESRLADAKYNSLAIS